MPQITVHITHEQYLELCWRAVKNGSKPAAFLEKRLEALARTGYVPISRYDWIEPGEEDDLRELLLEVSDGVMAYLAEHGEEVGGADALCRRIANALVPPKLNYW